MRIYKVVFIKRKFLTGFIEWNGKRVLRKVFAKKNVQLVLYTWVPSDKLPNTIFFSRFSLLIEIRSFFPLQVCLFHFSFCLICICFLSWKSKSIIKSTFFSNLKTNWIRDYLALLFTEVKFQIDLACRNQSENTPDRYTCVNTGSASNKRKNDRIETLSVKMLNMHLVAFASVIYY